jgi:hypothetical protein
MAANHKRLEYLVFLSALRLTKAAKPLDVTLPFDGNAVWIG